MLESKNILLDIGRAQNADHAGPAGFSQDAAAEKPEQFSALLGAAVGKFKAAESGNKTPLSTQQTAAADIKPPGLLSTRVLQGGTALIVAGPEPTDAGLLAFARAQGIDPEALGLAAAVTPQQSGATLNAAAFMADTVLSKSSSSAGASITRPGGVDRSVAEGSVVEGSVAGAATKQATLSNLMIKPLSPAADTSSISVQELAAKTASKGAELDNPMATINPNAATAVLQRTLLDGKFLSPQQHLSSAQHSNLASVGDDASMSNLKPHEAANPNSQNLSGKLTQGSLLAVDTVKKTLHIKPETTISSGRLEAGAASLDGASVATEASQLKIGPKMADAFLQQHRHRQNLAPTKMDAINLTEAKALTASASSTLSSAPVLSASVASAPMFAEATATSGAAASGLKSDLSAAAPAEDTRQEMLRRQDDYTQLSRQLTDALGKRLTAQIQRGSWHVEMELHPKSLGRVEVQLEMKNGELEARFIAANATTRDLINEGMPRLREAFQEHGTETAYKDLGTANQGADDGKPTASGNGAPGSDKRLDPDVEGVSGKNSQQLSADGLDVLV
ncbi:MAG: flagellar hook-length control protein FliK [Porticoccaceae bacterium]|jgi:flagellar hook-length control protein FliK|nr:flagellar hook-length control protein FliK [Porticoccaceae bacterium]